MLRFILQLAARWPESKRFIFPFYKKYMLT